MEKLILILILIPTTLFSQGWEKTYGGGNSDSGWSVKQTTDGGYIITGETASFGNGYDDVYLIKTDNYGDTLWTKTFGGAYNENGRSVQQTMDGGYIIAGSTESFGVGGHDVYLIKTDNYGDTIWTKTFGGVENDYGGSVQQTTDNGYIITGSTYSFGNGGCDVYLIKTDNNGDTLWTKTFGGVENDFATSVQQTTDEGYIITGGTYSFGGVYLIKTDSNGDTLWTKNGSYGSGESVQQTTDGGYIITGSYLSGWSDVYLIKTDNNGEIIWSMTYEGYGLDYGYSVQQTTEGGYVIVGSTQSTQLTEKKVLLIKTNSIGQALWAKVFGGDYHDSGFSVQQTTDDGYIITGYTQVSFRSHTNVYLIKTDEYGIITFSTEITASKSNKKLIKMVDLLGREINKSKKNKPYIEIYDDGTTQKKMNLR